MKVLHVYKEFFPVLGGIENHVRLLCRELARTGQVEPTVLVVNAGRETVVEWIDGVRVIKAGRIGQVASTPLSLALFRLIGREEADIAHLHFPYPLGELAQLTCGRARRVVITYHSDIVRQRKLLLVYRPFLQRVLRRADRILVTSPAYLQSSPYLQAVADKCVLSTLGVDPAPLERTPARARQAAELRQRLGEPLVLFVGKLRYYKGVEYSLEAMRTVPGKLVVVGDGPDGPRLRERARALGVSDRVVFTGEVVEADLPTYFHAADLFVLPSTHRSEALGLAQIEAMACGLPVICTELGTGTTYVNQHGETGLVVPPADAAALGRAIQDLLADPERRRRYGQAGRQRFERLFSAASMIARTVEVYRELTTDDRRPSSVVRLTYR